MMVAAIVASGVAGVAVLFAYSSMTAPYEEGFFFLRMPPACRSGVQALAENVTANVRRLGDARSVSSH